MLKINLINSHERSGGAAIATYRLLQGLNSISEIEAKIFCQHLDTSSSNVIGPKSWFERRSSSFRPYIDRLYMLKYGLSMLKNHNFSHGWMPSNTNNLHDSFNADIVHLNWINNGFLNVHSLKNITTPIVWTLHDMWTVTGGCHYSQDCTKYTTECGSCPHLNSNKKNDLSTSQQLIKKNILSTLPITLVCPSNWLAECAKSSAITKNNNIVVIPNGIDTDTFQPHNKLFSRNHFNLPTNKTLVLFNAANAVKDLRKGLDTCIKAMAHLFEHQSKNIELVLVGEDNKDAINSIFPIHSIGKISDEASLSLVYSACDIYVNPSKQDNLPNTILEAMACGTPCIASNLGGFPDMIDHNHNGFLCQPNDYKGFANYIFTLANDNNKNFSFSKSARAKIVNYFDIRIISKKYYNLYKKLLHKYENADH